MGSQVWGFAINLFFFVFYSWQDITCVFITAIWFQKTHQVNKILCRINRDAFCLPLAVRILNGNKWIGRSIGMERSCVWNQTSSACLHRLQLSLYNEALSSIFSSRFKVSWSPTHAIVCLGRSCTLYAGGTISTSQVVHASQKCNEMLILIRFDMNLEIERREMAFIVETVILYTVSVRQLIRCA